MTAVPRSSRGCLASGDFTHYLPAEPGAVSDQDWATRAGLGFSGRTTAGRDGLRRTLPSA